MKREIPDEGGALEQATERGPEGVPSVGMVVRVRTRTYLVEAADPSPSGTRVRLACLDDDAQGDIVEVVWELELDAEILSGEAWKDLGKKGFDEPRHFGAYVRTLRWNCVTATDPKLFQAPFRAGIRVDAYQLEPLRKALLLPRVNLFIADDVGLGKTIEAGLIASELLLRRRVRDIVVACPPTMLLQWKEELESRFGLTFQVLDRQYVDQVRRERGYGVNPWTTFPRFLVSHRLLIDEAYAGPMRDWLDNLRPGSLLILDEAHHAAPSGGARYAIDSRITRAIRDIAPRFEHRLFLSATPHNGHSNSFSALLEILDRNRFTRGVKTRAAQLGEVMVRRLKEDIREIQGGFPERELMQVDLDGLPSDAPELRLAALLDEYREVRQQRLAGATKRKQAEGGLLISGLQQRLFSSVEAFARTLRVHRRTMERLWAGEAAPAPEARAAEAQLVTGALASDDDRSQLPVDELTELEDEALATATAATAGDITAANIAREKQLLAEMEQVAETGRGQPDARVRYLLRWIKEHCCAGTREPGEPRPQPGALWTDLRVIIFTEYEDTRRYLVEIIRAAIADTDQAERRVEVFHGPTPPEKREAIRDAFNTPPAKHPLRILVATDAAREGLNLQAHCWNLFHLDLPWNPSRLEQRNGRIDRKLQPSPEVFCHYFVYVQRPEDRVLRTLVRKTEIIRKELGSLTDVLDNRLATLLQGGIRRGEVEKLERAIEAERADEVQRATVEEELEAARERQDALRKQIDGLRSRINDARKWIGLEAEMATFRDAISCALELIPAAPLAPAPGTTEGPARYVLPDLAARRGADSTWAATLDTLREPPGDGRRTFEWRRGASIRPVVFKALDTVDDSVVQLHLQHRVVQRLLGRFIAQGFVHHDLSRACLAQTGDAIPRAVLMGRLSLYGAGAVRLHEEMLLVAARWTEPATRRSPLAPYGRDAEAKSRDLLEAALGPGGGRVPQRVQETLLGSIDRDVEELLPHLQRRGVEAEADARTMLAERGRIESEAMLRVLEDQRKRVIEQVAKAADVNLELFGIDERRTFESNRRYWRDWLENVDGDIAREPGRISAFYEVTSRRLEPVGLAYLWPVTG